MVCAVGTCVSELRENGYDIVCRWPTVNDKVVFPCSLMSG